MKKFFILAMFMGISLPLFAQKKKQTTKKKVVAKPKIVKKAPAPEKEETINFTEVQNENTTAPMEDEVEKIGKAVEKKSGYIRNRNSVYSKGILAFIKGVYVSKKHIYFLFEVKNKSNIDYDIEGTFFNTNSVKRRNENLELDEKLFIPVWDNGVKNFKTKSWTKVVYAFDKFTINDNKVLNFIIREENGEREINLAIKPEMIINAEFIRVK